MALSLIDTLFQSWSMETEEWILICSHTFNAVENIKGIRVKSARCHTMIFSFITKYMNYLYCQSDLKYNKLFRSFYQSIITFLSWGIIWILY